ncbi:non-ribosomal peptide synthetase [Pedobacter alluvionis]|uniref:Amino acid adenylation domain-containing protein n=1 Tax=Pedobacter alluvionis TaxID=475253 RepID=A0A497XTI9_9SPHI|nr:non-ribosomal peptide synthetase [Pedobacter alluvionis]RLJ72738.1 FkbM family methyltransferase/non-ribosomal peptide synthase protein (TIGR01720 family)/amino acid adenylation domain-containing protein [Pedobacter alluvionis]TFB29422.1 amino acid adenylation domain-containing protein [Pedobacter alluvionis]
MIEELIDRLLSYNIKIELLDGNQLKIHTAINNIPPDLLSELKLKKELLIGYLKEQQKIEDFNRIPVAALEDSYVLSSSQRRLWILNQLNSGDIAYNIPGVYIFNGNLVVENFETALRTLIERHEILRTVFREDLTYIVKQHICSPDKLPFDLEIKDLRAVAEKNEEVKRLLELNFKRPFDLASGPLIRFSIFHTEDNVWIFSYVMHHIVSDAWSMGILVKELLLIYNAGLLGKHHGLAPLRINYKDFAVWQQAQLSSNTAEKLRDYWLDIFSGELPVLALQTDKLRPAVQTFNGARVTKRFQSGTGKLIKDFCQQQDCTLFMGLLTVLNVFLNRYTHNEDIIVGSPIAGRGHTDLEDQIGFYINTLALRTKLNHHESFLELLEKVKTTVLGAFDHQDYPFDQLVEELKINRDQSRNALFDVAITVQGGDFEATTQQLGDLSVERYNGYENLVSKFDLLFVFVTYENELQVTLEYNSDLFTQETVNRMADHLAELTHALIQHFDQPVGALNFIDESERHRLLTEFNDTNFTFNHTDDTLTSWFEKIAVECPDEIAVVFEDQQLDYRTLNEEANKLAVYLLQNYEISPETFVGVMLDRSHHLIISILAILKTGAVYVPIDATYPKARKEYIIEDTGLQLLITQSEYIFDIESFGGQVFAIDIQLDVLSAVDVFPKVDVRAEQLAYVIYTSGSTGMPKGVMISHKGIVNTIASQQKIFDIKPNERGLQFASASFDASMSEIFIILLAGGTVYIIEESKKKNPWMMEQFISDHSIDIATIPPAYLQLLNIDNMKPLRKLITAGEPAHKNKVEEFLTVGTYFNAYGPTESSICATVLSLEKNSIITQPNVPMGKPIDNTQIYILDELLALVPIGLMGEIFIGGDGLARGYLNKKSLTDEKFIENPFKPGERLYRTGDLGRWLSDGNIEFVGRKDQQIKLNGYRIEMEEIEQVMMQQPGIKAATVVLQADEEGNKNLMAYYIPADDLLSVGQSILKHKTNDFLNGRVQFYELNNEFGVYANHKKEAEFLYKEIFQDKTYSQYGIRIADGDCIFDVGANIGMFSLYSSMSASNLRIYAFEPLPPIFELLKLNVAVYGGDIQIFNEGLSNLVETASFTYFPNSTALSSRYSDQLNIKNTVGQYVINTEARNSALVSDVQIDSFLDSHLREEKFECNLKTLSTIIAAHDIDVIDLLKVDVEGGEMDVLEGIDEADWSKIKQIVLEVHDINGRLEIIKQLLTSHFFQIHIHQHEDLHDTKLFNIYAISEVHATGITKEKEASTPNVNNKWLAYKELKNGLRQRIEKQLPSYMVPHHLVELDEFPLTTNGKIDKQALPGPPDSGSEKVSAYVAPETQLEKDLISICSDVLKREQISMKDDLFAMGGDSIKSIQIVSRLKQKGYTLTISEVMQFPVLEDMVTHISSVTREIEQEVVKGNIPLSPIQSDFFLKEIPDRHHFNQSVLLFSKNSVDEEGLRKVLDQIVIHHDALRMVYRQKPEGWEQENRDLDQGYDLMVTNYTDETTFLEYCNQIQSTISLSEGPLFRVGLFRGTTGDRLLLVIHHLVTDGVSWRILFEDLSSLYQQYLNGEPLILPLKTDSFSYWQERQIAYTKTEELLAEDEFWQVMNAGSDALLPVDHEHGENLFKDVSSITFSLSEAQTVLLLTKCHHAYRTEINDILLTALSVALSDQFELESISVKLEGHGRENIGADLDVTRTVGWFTSAYPVKFEMSDRDDMIRQLLKIKDCLHRIPNKGIGYGILRYLAGKNYSDNPPVSFNYLGDFGSGTDTAGGEQIFEFSAEAHGSQMADTLGRDTQLDVSGKVVLGTLRLSIAYNTRQYEYSTIKQLSDAYMNNLMRLIELLSGEEEVHLSPVDFTYKGLSFEQLDKLNKLL